MSNSQDFITFGPDANCTFELCPVEWTVYGYRPSLPANIVFIALFNLAMVIHIYLGIRWKTWWYMWCMILGCINETTGYVGRILMYYNPWSFVAFIIQIICITQAPVFFCAAIYVTLAQTINHFSPKLARFPPKFLYWVFIPFDIVSLGLQGAGGALSADSSGSSQLGVNIAMAGLILQVIMLVGFSGLLGDYVIRYLRSESAQEIGGRVKLFFGFLSLAVLTTLIRCIFRADELKEGYSGDLISNESLFVGLDGVLIVIAVFCLCVGHPGFIFKGKRLQNYSSANITEMHRELISVPHEG